MSKNTGKLAEEFVGKILKKMGYEILNFNFHTRFGEIDIVARNKEYILFVEVKAREKGSLVSGFEAVNRQKQRKIILSAKHYLSLKQIDDLQPRFDVVSVELLNSKISSYDYLENAFGE